MNVGNCSLFLNCAALRSKLRLKVLPFSDTVEIVLLVDDFDPTDYAWIWMKSGLAISYS